MVSWLKEQQAGAEATYLSFHGKNLVVYVPTDASATEVVDQARPAEAAGPNPA